MKIVNLIGCGRLGKTIAKLMVLHADYQVGAILSRSQETRETALEFIGQGKAVSNYQELPPADVVLIAVPDDAITDVALELHNTPLKPNSIAFHCSGALGASALAQLKTQSISIASVHPALSFASPETVVKNFAGCYSTVEGDEYACEILIKDFTKMGAHCIHITAEQKLFCHIAMVFACNYFTTLMDAAIRACQCAGFAETQALALLRPLMASSFEQIFSLGPVRALTGPIVRGDVTTVSCELNLLRDQQSQLAEIYQLMGLKTAELAKRNGKLTENQYLKLEKVLLNPSSYLQEEG